RRRPHPSTLAVLARVLGLSDDDRAAWEDAARIASQPAATPAPGTGEAETTARHNLPIALTSFIGREGERARVKWLLATARLLTLPGAGGVGKTRLALQVGADLVGEYPEGVWLVDLSPLSDGALVPDVVADAVGVRGDPGQPIRA